jgi:two-component system copper resistance phosphate regulon response regulator CusR
MNRILIAEDEDRIASFIHKGLRANGFAPTIARHGDEAMLHAVSGQFDLVILDLGLPGKDGLEILEELRRKDPRLPVVVLTARDSVRDKVAGLELGADDYITKPFSFDELLARVRARLRGDRPREVTMLRVGAAALDLRTRRARVGERTVELTAREFAMAEMLFRHPGQVLSREQLLSHVWGYDYDPGSNVVDVYVGYLRKKLGKERITSARGMGYRLETLDAEEPAGQRHGQGERQGER